MARSGYLLDDLLVGRGLELVGGHVAKGAVQAGAVEPGDVFHGRVACGGAGGPGLVVEALAFQGGEERLGERVVPALAGAARRQADREIVGEGGVVAAGVLGGFNWSSQHLGNEGLRWEQGSVEQLIVPVVRRCVRRAVHRWGDASTASGSGWRSPAGPPAKMPAWRPVCPRPWDHAGSVKAVACQQSAAPRCQGATCRSPSEKRSPSSAPKTSGCARSHGSWDGPPRPSPGSCAATPQPVAAGWSIGPRPPSGTPTVVPGAPRSPTCCRATSPMMGPCGSPTRPSTRPCTSKVAAPCAVS